MSGGRRSGASPAAPGLAALGLVALVLGVAAPPATIAGASDVTPPTVEAPVLWLRWPNGGIGSEDGIMVKALWSGSDADSGIDFYTVEIREQVGGV